MHSHQHIKTVLATTLALSAITAPTALANGTVVRPNPDEQTAIASPATHTRAAPVVQPNPDTRTVDGVPPILPAPSVSQRAAILRAQAQERQGLAYTVPQSARYSNAETNAYASGTPASIPNAVVRVVSHDGGFDWGDAGIGAAGGLALSLVAFGGALTVGRHRERQLRSATRAAG